MKIMFCLGGLNKGGAERVASNLCNYFIKKNHEVQILVTRLDTISYELSPKIKIETLDNTDNKENILKHNIKLVNNMKKKIISYKPDIIISFLKEPTGRVLFLKKTCNKIKNIPLIISVRADPKSIYNSFFHKLITKFLYNEADGYVFQTEDAKKFFNKKIQNKSIIIPNPIDEKFLVLPSNQREKKIVTLGRLTSQKNHKLLIDAFKIVLKKYPDYKLYIFGEGPLKQELTNYIYENNISDNILLQGVVDDVKSVIYNSEMFVLSSNFEGMPNALMEAMALGIPCISTDSSGGGAKFLIKNNENGILVSLNNLQELSDSMIKIIENKKLAKKISINANMFMKQFRPQLVNEKWLDYINKIKNNHT